MAREPQLGNSLSRFHYDYEKNTLKAVETLEEQLEIRRSNPASAEETEQTRSEDDAALLYNLAC